MSEDERVSSEGDSGESDRSEPPGEPRDDEEEGAEANAEGHAAFHRDALYSPDDAIARPEGEIPKDAIYSPDDPIVREQKTGGVVMGMAGEEDEEPLSGEELIRQIHHMAHVLETLARDLQERGMEALRLRPDSDPADAMLRTFVGGYLVGRSDVQD
jgi:hypothetical protein